MNESNVLFISETHKSWVPLHKERVKEDNIYAITKVIESNIAQEPSSSTVRAASASSSSHTGRNAIQETIDTTNANRFHVPQSRMTYVEEDAAAPEDAWFPRERAP